MALTVFDELSIRLYCIGSKEESSRLTKPSQTPTYKPKNVGAPDIARLSTHIPQEGPLSQQQYWDRIDYCSAQETVAGRYNLEFAYVSQRGFYPDDDRKPNQDAVFVKSRFGNKSDQHFFGVFDGHGENGADISQFAAKNVSRLTSVSQDPCSLIVLLQYLKTLVLSLHS